mmetsp:Transcript_229/g.682  ORF Transcript_229/g.682 Transcript_229/m.682 type:complete len:518 (+) Transcript_229:744-2297(+)|eukprot:scaffold14068_cov119-Isochrysis_galbana.AAC.20
MAGTAPARLGAAAPPIEAANKPSVAPANDMSARPHPLPPICPHRRQAHGGGPVGPESEAAPQRQDGGMAPTPLDQGVLQPRIAQSDQRGADLRRRLGVAIHPPVPRVECRPCNGAEPRAHGTHLESAAAREARPRDERMGARRAHTAAGGDAVGAHASCEGHPRARGACFGSLEHARELALHLGAHDENADPPDPRTPHLAVEDCGEAANHAVLLVHEPLPRVECACLLPAHATGDRECTLHDANLLLARLCRALPPVEGAQELARAEVRERQAHQVVPVGEAHPRAHAACERRVQQVQHRRLLTRDLDEYLAPRAPAARETALASVAERAPSRLGRARESLPRSERLAQARHDAGADRRDALESVELIHHKADPLIDRTQHAGGAEGCERPATHPALLHEQLPRVPRVAFSRGEARRRDAHSPALHRCLIDVRHPRPEAALEPMVQEAGGRDAREREPLEVLDPRCHPGAEPHPSLAHQLERRGPRLQQVLPRAPRAHEALARKVRECAALSLEHL